MEETYTREEVTQVTTQIHQNYKEQISCLEEEHQKEIQKMSSELQKLQSKVPELTEVIQRQKQENQELKPLKDILNDKEQMIQTLLSDKRKLKQTVQSLTEKIEMQSKSDLMLKELKEKQKDLEQREANLEKKTLVVTTGEEANAEREKELKAWENRLCENSRE